MVQSPYHPEQGIVELQCYDPHMDQGGRRVFFWLAACMHHPVDNSSFDPPIIGYAFCSACVILIYHC